MMEPLRKVSLREKLDAFDDRWSPKTVARVNEFALKVVKIDGEFVWHHHDAEDEVFLIVTGSIAMHYLRDGIEEIVTFGPGELLCVPRGVEHKPVAEPGTEIVLFEREAMVNTGNVRDERFTAPQAAI
jgi:mannose-6-phosphate isomerase-like protein (cupin superfamily)